MPFFSLLCLGCAVAFFSGALDEREQLPRGTLPGLATFFVLFLSSHRLSFLESESTFWSESFWSTPQLGIALAGLHARAREYRQALTAVGAVDRTEARDGDGNLLVEGHIAFFNAMRAPWRST